ncbi:hemerythrin domain-containing protein [Kitasatospora sp. NPDC001540]|uniref:hemerythrin domain-containing protein n=1 Tax=Kitasatospora sp. NPDC001540 TaxID=3364014 RepID=UPI0036C423D6
MNDRLDMTVTRTVHDALRRELPHLAHAAAHRCSVCRADPRETVGWHLLVTALVIHQGAEEEALWPPLRRALAGRPLDLARVEAIEVEHCALTALVDSIAGAPADPDDGPGSLLDLITSFVTGLERHLDHEESAVLPLVQAFLSQDQWDDFTRVHARRIAPASPLLLPWLLDEADERTVTAVLSGLLPRSAWHGFTHRWRPAYAELDVWDSRGEACALLG